MSPFLIITDDGGFSWKNVALNKSIMNAYFSDMYPNDNTIFAITTDSVFSSNDGEQWKEIFKSGKPIIDGNIKTNEIAILTNGELYLSHNKGENWTSETVPEDIRNVNLYKDVLYIASEKSIFKKELDKWLEVLTPIKGNILEVKFHQNYIVSYSSENIGVFNKEINKWNIYDLPKEIKEIFTYIIEGHLYLSYPNGDIFKLKQGGDTSEWISLNEKRPRDEGMAALLLGSDGELFYYLMPKVSWKSILKESVSNEKKIN